jgi:hypothetical protein
VPNKFIKVNVIEAKPIYTEQNLDDNLRELVCGVTLVDPSNNQPINISMNEDSARIIILGSLQYLGELGDSVAISMVHAFMESVDVSEIEGHSDEPDSN